MKSLYISETMQRAATMASAYQKIMESLDTSETMQRVATMASVYQKAMKTMDSNETMQRIATMASAYQKAMKSLDSSETMQRIAIMASAYQKAMKSLDSSETMQRVATMASTYQKAMNSFASSEALQRAIHTFSEPSNLLATLNSIDQLGNRNLIEEFSEAEFGNEELAQNLAEIGEAKDTESFIYAFSKLTPTLKYLLLFFIIQLLAITQNIAANIVTPHIEKLFSNPTITEKEKIKQLKALNLDDLNLSNLRFITTERLYLRESQSSKSTIKDELRLGQVVTVLNRKRNWMEVSYTLEDGEIIQGWVFSRYTEKFRKSN